MPEQTNQTMIYNALAGVSNYEIPSSFYVDEKQSKFVDEHGFRYDFHNGWNMISEKQADELIPRLRNSIVGMRRKSDAKKMNNFIDQLCYKFGPEFSRLNGAYEMGKSNANEWKPHLDLTLKIKPTDEVTTLKTNKVSQAPINKRGYGRLKATVILGTHTVKNNKIEIKAGDRIWSCQIDERGAVSSIGLPEAEVTVIIHGAKKESE